MSEKIYRLPVNPQTHVRATQKDALLFRIPQECPYTLKPGNTVTFYKGIREFKGVVSSVEETHSVINAAGRSMVVPNYKITACSGDKCKHKLSYHGLRRLTRLIRYNEYKEDVLAAARGMNLTIPWCGFSIYFYIPMPKRWPKKFRAMMHGQHHMRKPDLDNLEKAFFDSLKVADERISQLSGHGKFWVDSEKGWIEVRMNQPLFNPFGVEFIDQKKYNYGSAIERKKRSGSV